MSAEETSRPRSGSPVDVVRDVFGRNDGFLIAGYATLIYALFTVVVWVVFPPEAFVNALFATLVQLTFFMTAYALLTLALNLHWGYTGLFNIGVAGFMAVGVYTMAILTNSPDPGPTGVPGFGLPLPVGIVGGVLAAAIIGLVAALPALRLDADYLAIVTVALSEIIRLILNSTTFQEMTIAGVTFGTGGARGTNLPGSPVRDLFYRGGNPANGPTGFGEAAFSFFEGLGITRPPVVIDSFYAASLVVAVLVFYYFLRRVGNSPFGRVLKAIREDELVARSLGKDTNLFKMKVFAVGCGLMGLAAIIWSIGFFGFVNPVFFRPVITFYVFVALIIGGAGSNTGSVLGAMTFSGLLLYLPQLFEQSSSQVLNLLSGGRQIQAPNNVIDAVGTLFGLDPFPFLAYTLNNIGAVRFIAIGVLLVILMQRRPDGLLGHRKEDAASVDLHDRSGTGDSEPGRPAADGGERTDGPRGTSDSSDGGERTDGPRGTSEPSDGGERDE